MTGMCRQRWTSSAEEEEVYEEDVAALGVAVPARLAPAPVADVLLRVVVEDVLQLGYPMTTMSSSGW